MAKVESCGVVITDGKYVLGCLPTGRKLSEKNSLDLPKGRKDPGETDLECAMRELREETGLVPQEQELQFIKKYSYRPEKDLSVFVWAVDELPSLSSLHCESQFLNPYTKAMTYEHCDFIYIEYKDVKKRFFSSLGAIILDSLGF